MYISPFQLSKLDLPRLSNVFNRTNLIDVSYDVDTGGRLFWRMFNINAMSTSHNLIRVKNGTNKLYKFIPL
jgi:hypothetical protein